MEEVLLCGMVYCSLSSTMQEQGFWAAESFGGLVRHSLPASPPESVNRQGRAGLRTCISSKLRGDATAAGPTPRLETQPVVRARTYLPVERSVNWHQGYWALLVGGRGGVHTIWKSPRHLQFESLISRL